MIAICQNCTDLTQVAQRTLDQAFEIADRYPNLLLALRGCANAMGPIAAAVRRQTYLDLTQEQRRVHQLVTGAKTAASVSVFLGVSLGLTELAVWAMQSRPHARLNDMKPLFAALMAAGFATASSGIAAPAWEPESSQDYGALRTPEAVRAAFLESMEADQSRLLK